MPQKSCPSYHGRFVSFRYRPIDLEQFTQPGAAVYGLPQVMRRDSNRACLVLESRDSHMRFASPAAGSTWLRTPSVSALNEGQ